jgi:hypothetical protein
MLTALKTLAGVAILKNSCETGGGARASNQAKLSMLQPTPAFRKNLRN